MKKAIAMLSAMLIAFPLMAFSCFGIREGFTKEECEEAGAKFLEMSKDYGTYQVWQFSPTPLNKSRFFNAYYVYIDQDVGAFKIIAHSDPYEKTDYGYSRLTMYFNWAKWDYAEKYNLNKDEIHEENVMLEIGEYGDERITLYKFNADSTFLADTFIYEKQISNPIIFVIYEGKSSEKAYEAYDNQQLTII